MKTNLHAMFEAMEREGEPDDDYLNPAEVNIALPKMIENRLRNVTCKGEKDAFTQCQAKYGLMSSFICISELMSFNFCTLRNRDSDDLVDDCTEEYLTLRSQYRRTKDPSLLKKMKAMVQPSKYGPET